MPGSTRSGRRAWPTPRPCGPLERSSAVVEDQPGSPPAFDVTHPPAAWTREQRVQLARALRPHMGTAEIARRLGVSTSTVRGYLSDPDGHRARARRESRPRGTCARCGQRTGVRRGARVFALCPRCAAAERADWTRAAVIAAYLDWWARFDAEPTSTDWNHTHARRRAGAALDRFRARRWPTLTVVARLFGQWSELRAAARERSRSQSPRPPPI